LAFVHRLMLNFIVLKIKHSCIIHFFLLRDTNYNSVSALSILHCGPMFSTSYLACDKTTIQQL
jgi:hypothetical protein